MGLIKEKPCKEITGLDVSSRVVQNNREEVSKQISMLQETEREKEPKEMKVEDE